LDAHQYNDTGYLSVTLLSSCGSGNHSFKIPVEISSYSPSKSYSVYPNPVSDILTIEIDYEAITGAQRFIQAPTFDIRLYNQLGNQVRQTTTKSGSVQFNVSNLPDGIYFLHINDGVSKIRFPICRQLW
jgi:hypothetical protein